MNIDLESEDFGQKQKVVKKANVSYIDKNESMFLLGLLRPVSCSHCPDFYKGCSGTQSIMEQASLSEKDYIKKHIEGTENFICGKLRNILNLSCAEEQEVHNQFEKDFNNRISYLTTRESNPKQFVMVYDKDELKDNLKKAEQDLFNKLNKDVEQANDKNYQAVQTMQGYIQEQAVTIQTMQEEIIRQQEELEKKNKLIYQLKKKKHA
jgi:hypothetical protein